MYTTANSHKLSHAIYLWCHNFKHNTSCCTNIKVYISALLLRKCTHEMYLHWNRNEIWYFCEVFDAFFCYTWKNIGWIWVWFSFSVAAFRLTLCVYSVDGWMDGRHCSQFTSVACWLWRRRWWWWCRKRLKFNACNTIRSTECNGNRIVRKREFNWKSTIFSMLKHTHKHAYTTWKKKKTTAWR